MTAPLINRNSQSGQERVKSATTNLNEPYACKECGSTFFEQRNAIQCTVSNYAVRGTSISPQMYYVCIGCGFQLVPGNLANMANKGGEREMFLASVDLGKEYRAKLNPNKLIKSSASIFELEEVKTQVSALQLAITGILEHLSENDVSSDDIVEDKEVENTPIEKITRRQGQKKN